MKTFVVETSLYEAIRVDIGGKIYETVPLSKKLIDAVQAVEMKMKDKTVESLEGNVRLASLIFGVPFEEFEQIDLRALTPAVEHAMKSLNEGWKPKPTAVAADILAPAAGEAESEKNGLKPGSETLQ